MISVDDKIKLLKVWCNSYMIGNLMTKNDWAVRDMYPYEKSTDRTQEHKSLFHCPPVGCVYPSKWGGFGEMKNNDKSVGNIEIRYPRYTPQVTFEQFLNKHNG